MFLLNSIKVRCPDVVFDELSSGGALEIEGGSHYRSDLLPLKAGVAIMGLKWVPVTPTMDFQPFHVV